MSSLGLLSKECTLLQELRDYLWGNLLNAQRWLQPRNSARSPVSDCVQFAAQNLHAIVYRQLGHIHQFFQDYGTIVIVCRQANLISVCTPAQLKCCLLINRQRLCSLESHAVNTKAVYWLVGAPFFSKSGYKEAVDCLLVLCVMRASGSMFDAPGDSDNCVNRSVLRDELSTRQGFDANTVSVRSEELEAWCSNC